MPRRYWRGIFRSGIALRDETHFTRIGRSKVTVPKKKPPVSGGYEGLISNRDVVPTGTRSLALAGQRSDQHDHLAAFHLREVLHTASFFCVLCHTLQQFATKVLVRHLAATEAQRDFYLVAILKKLENVAHFHFVIIGVGVRTELDLFDFDDLLLFAGLALALLLFIFELAKIHDFAHGRVGIWRNLDQIKPGLFGHFHGTGGRYHSDVFTVGADQADFIGPDLVVYARAGISLGRRVVWSASDGYSPLIVDVF